MATIDEVRALAVQKLLINFLPTFQEFLNSLSANEQVAFVTYFYEQPRKAAALVETRIRQLATAQAEIYVDSQIATGQFPVTDVQVFFD